VREDVVLSAPSLNALTSVTHDVLAVILSVGAQPFHVLLSVCDSVDDFSDAALAGLSDAVVGYQAIFLNTGRWLPCSHTPCHKRDTICSVVRFRAPGGFFRQQFGVDWQGVLELRLVLLVVSACALLWFAFVAVRARFWVESARSGAASPMWKSSRHSGVTESEFASESRQTWRSTGDRLPLCWCCLAT